MATAGPNPESGKGNKEAGNHAVETPSHREEEKQPTSSDSGFVVLDGWSWGAKNLREKRETTVVYSSSSSHGTPPAFNFICAPKSSASEFSIRPNVRTFQPGVQSIRNIGIPTSLCANPAGQRSPSHKSTSHLGDAPNPNCTESDGGKKEKRKAREAFGGSGDPSLHPLKMPWVQEERLLGNAASKERMRPFAMPFSTECEMTLDSESPHHPQPLFHPPKSTKFTSVIDEGSSSGKFKIDGGLMPRALGRTPSDVSQDSFRKAGKSGSLKELLTKPVAAGYKKAGAVQDAVGENGLGENATSQKDMRVSKTNLGKIRSSEDPAPNLNDSSIQKRFEMGAGANFLAKSLLTLGASHESSLHGGENGGYASNKSKETTGHVENVDDSANEASSTPMNLNDQGPNEDVSLSDALNHSCIKSTFPSYSDANTDLNLNLNSVSTSARFSSRPMLLSTTTSDISQSQHTSAVSQLQLSSFDYSPQCVSQQSIEESEYSMYALSDPTPSVGIRKLDDHIPKGSSFSTGSGRPKLNQKECRIPGCESTIRGYSGLCVKHGGGKRCQEESCEKPAEGKSMRCFSHGGGRHCQVEGCNKSARGASGKCIRHGGGKRCLVDGCTRSAEGLTGKCIKHGGGKRCQFLQCNKAAQGGTNFCKGHGGGRRCSFTNCNKAAEGKGAIPLCKGHGGGRRCKHDDGACGRSVHGGTDFCIAHGGGKRCKVSGCEKSARGRTDFCVKHGGGKRCAVANCGKSAQGRTDFCKRHGGGKRCSWRDESGTSTCTKFARCKSGMCAAHAGKKSAMKEFQTSKKSDLESLPTSSQSGKINEEKIGNISKSEGLHVGSPNKYNLLDSRVNFQPSQTYPIGYYVAPDNVLQGIKPCNYSVPNLNAVQSEMGAGKWNGISWPGLNICHSVQPREPSNMDSFSNFQRENTTNFQHMSVQGSNFEISQSKENFLCLRDDRIHGNVAENGEKKKESNCEDINLNLSIGHSHSSDLNPFQVKIDKQCANPSEDKEKMRSNTGDGLTRNVKNFMSMDQDMGFALGTSPSEDGNKTDAEVQKDVSGSKAQMEFTHLLSSCPSLRIPSTDPSHPHFNGMKEKAKSFSSLFHIPPSPSSSPSSSSLVSLSLSSPSPKTKSNSHSNPSAFRAYSGKNSSKPGLLRVHSELAMSNTYAHFQANMYPSNVSPIAASIPLFPQTQNGNCVSTNHPLGVDSEVLNQPSPSLNVHNHSVSHVPLKTTFFLREHQVGNETPSPSFEAVKDDQGSAFKPVIGLKPKFNLSNETVKANGDDRTFELNLNQGVKSHEFHPNPEFWDPSQTQSLNQVLLLSPGVEGRVRGGSSFMPSFRDFLRKN